MNHRDRRAGHWGRRGGDFCGEEEHVGAIGKQQASLDAKEVFVES